MNKLNRIKDLESELTELKSELSDKINKFYDSERSHTKPKNFNEVGDDVLNGFISKYISIFYGVDESFDWLSYPKSTSVGHFTFNEDTSFNQPSIRYHVTYGKTIIDLIDNYLESMYVTDLKKLWLSFCGDVFIPCECGFSDFKSWVKNSLTVGKDSLVDDVVRKFKEHTNNDIELIDLRELNHDVSTELYIIIVKEEKNKHFI